MNTKI